MKIYQAVEFIGLLQGGSTYPWLVEVVIEDGNSQSYAVKMFTQYNAVAHEVIANELANLLGLSVPKKAFIEFDEKFINRLPEKQKKQITSNFIGGCLKFGTVLIDNAKIYGQSPQPALEEYEYEDIYAFDNLIYNIDRRTHKPDMLVRKENYYLIDHELCFKGISENTISAVESNQWKYYYQRHLFYPILQRRKDKSRLFENFEYNLIELNIKELENIFPMLDAYGYSYENQGIFLNYLRYIQANYRKFVTILKKTNIMNDYFKYSLLKYKYSQALGEVLNVGLLLFFPNEWRFIYPHKLTRLKDFYPDVEEEHLRSYLVAFEAHAHKLNQKIQSHETPFEEGFHLDNFMEKVYSEFLPRDGSALQFEEARTPVLYSANRNKIVDNLYQKYFFPYELANDRHQKDESVILRQIRNHIKNIGSDIFERHFRNQEAKQITNNKTSLTIDLYWKNGKTHLVQPISLDLRRDSSIDRKANQYFGKFVQLQNEIQQGNYLLDIPIAKPTDKTLFKDYDRALYILGDAPAVTIIEEQELKNYAEKTVNELASHTA